jgi:hypothetical protein
MSPEDVEAALAGVARETGRPLSAVRRVFQIQIDSYAVGFTWGVIDGVLTAVNHNKDDCTPPRSIWNEADAAHNDMVDLCDHINLAASRLVTGMHHC